MVIPRSVRIARRARMSPSHIATKARMRDIEDLKAEHRRREILHLTEKKALLEEIIELQKQVK